MVEIIRYGEKINTQVYIEDVNIGGSFQSENHKGIKTVFIADKWELIVKKQYK